MVCSCYRLKIMVGASKLHVWWMYVCWQHGCCMHGSYLAIATERLGTAAGLFRPHARAGSLAANLPSQHVCLQQCASGGPPQGHRDEWPLLHAWRCPECSTAACPNWAPGRQSALGRGRCHCKVGGLLVISVPFLGLAWPLICQHTLHALALTACPETGMFRLYSQCMHQEEM